MAKTTGNGLRELKRIKRPKPKRCDGHYWLIDHTIYACDRGNEDAFTVHRQCHKCGRHEICRVRHPVFTNNVKSYELPDLRS